MCIYIHKHIFLKFQKFYRVRATNGTYSSFHIERFADTALGARARKNAARYSPPVTSRARTATPVRARHCVSLPFASHVRRLSREVAKSVCGATTRDAASGAGCGALCRRANGSLDKYMMAVATE